MAAAVRGATGFNAFYARRQFVVKLPICGKSALAVGARIFFRSSHHRRDDLVSHIAVPLECAPHAYVGMSTTNCVPCMGGIFIFIYDVRVITNIPFYNLYVSA